MTDYSKSKHYGHDYPVTTIHMVRWERWSPEAQRRQWAELARMAKGLLVEFWPEQQAYAFKLKANDDALFTITTDQVEDGDVSALIERNYEMAISFRLSPPQLRNNKRASRSSVTTTASRRTRKVWARQ